MVLYLVLKERVDYFVLIVFLVSYDCLCSVALLPDAVGWPADV